MKVSKSFVALVSLIALSACNGGGGTYSGDPADIGPTWIYNDPFFYVSGPTNDPFGYWMSPDGTIYSGGWSINSEDGNRSRDTITNAAAAKRRMIHDNAVQLQARYGLDADVAGRVVSALNEWSTFASSRKRTDADLAAFASRLSGLNPNDVAQAYVAAGQGDQATLDQAVEKAARVWSMKPDTMKQILADWLKQQR